VLDGQEGEELIALALERKRVLMVGHLLQYHQNFLHYHLEHISNMLILQEKPKQQPIACRKIQSRHQYRPKFQMLADATSPLRTIQEVYAPPPPPPRPLTPSEALTFIPAAPFPPPPKPPPPPPPPRPLTPPPPRPRSPERTISSATPCGARHTSCSITPRATCPKA
jgi:hypothetical protein